jgi:RNA polymerase sigma-70 factor (ECF subfamily)
MPHEPGEITVCLKAWCNGDRSALEQLAPVVEAELRRLARLYLKKEAPGHTLQPTALINEACLRLIEWNGIEWQNRAHFFAVAAKIMRRVLVNQAVARRAQKRGGLAVLVSLSEAGGCRTGARTWWRWTKQWSLWRSWMSGSAD